MYQSFLVKNPKFYKKSKLFNIDYSIDLLHVSILRFLLFNT